MTSGTMTKEKALHSKAAAKDTAKNPEQNGMIKGIARLGYLAKGIVYLFVGGLAILTAAGMGGQLTGSKGAFHSMLQVPFGTFLLWGVAIGLAFYSIWRVIQAVADPENKGKDLKGIGTRLVYTVSAIIHGSLAFAAFSLVTGNGSGSSGGSSQQALTGKLLAQPMGTLLVVIVSGILFIAGINQIYKGWTRKFLEKFKIGQMSPAEMKATKLAGRFGLMSRGVVFGIFGWFLLDAARNHDPSETGGMGKALASIAQTTYGSILLGLVAVGLFGYGIYCGFLARYRNIL